MLQERTPGWPRYRYNRTNSDSLVTAMRGARTKKVGNQWKKDKGDEAMVNGKPVIPPHLATHLTEAADMVIWGKYKHLVADLDSTFVPNG